MDRFGGDLLPRTADKARQPAYRSCHVPFPISFACPYEHDAAVAVAGAAHYTTAMTRMTALIAVADVVVDDAAVVDVDHGDNHPMPRRNDQTLPLPCHYHH